MRSAGASGRRAAFQRGMNCGGGRDTVAEMLRAGALALAAAFVCAAPADGAYPGRNGRVAYVESALGRIGSGWGPTIVSVRLDGTGRQTLTTATRTSGDFEPAWSPDGRRLAYVHSTGRQLGPGTSGTEIWVMNADGSEQAAAHAERALGREPDVEPRRAEHPVRARPAVRRAQRAAERRPLGHAGRRPGSAAADANAGARARSGVGATRRPACLPRRPAHALVQRTPLHRRPRARALDLRARRDAQAGRRPRRRPHPLRPDVVA